MALGRGVGAGEGPSCRQLAPGRPNEDCAPRSAASPTLSKARTVEMGDRVAIHMLMISETASAMLAGARAAHTVGFGPFLPDSLARARMAK